MAGIEETWDHKGRNSGNLGSQGDMVATGQGKVREIQGQETMFIPQTHAVKNVDTIRSSFGSL